MITGFPAAFFVFLFGLCIGSFLNCVIYRLEKGESFAAGRSYCPACKHQLQWLDLVPLASFLFLQGKCRYCAKPISWQYPLVEITTGFLFLLIFYIKFPFSGQIGILPILNLVFLFYIASSLLVIFVYDVKYYLIPDKVLFPAIGLAFIYRVFENMADWQALLYYMLAAVIASGFFLTFYLVSKGEWMGFGDVKLAILLGLVLGFPGILTGLFLSFFFGAIIGLALIFFHKKGLKSQLPFAPFLIGGTFVALFWGGEIISWYQHFLIF